MNKIDSFTHIIVSQSRSNDHPVIDPGTIYVNKRSGKARWQCPCGCGNEFKIDIHECKVFDPYERFLLPENIAGYEFDEDGSISLSGAFYDTRCPNGYIYGIEHNNVIVYAENGPDN